MARGRSDNFAASADGDFGAGIAICRGAGCVVTDLTGEALEDGRGLVVCSDPDTHHELITITSRHLQQQDPG